MIVFDLKCDKGHQFECWFRSSTDYDDQQARALLECPYCGSGAVTKAMMAPSLTAKSNQKQPQVTTAPAPVPAPAAAPAAASVSSPDPSVATAPNLDDVVAGGQLPADIRNELDQVMQKIRTVVSDKCDYVGDRFVDEARKIHYGESEERGIYGEASMEETAELLDEGIEVLPLPAARRSDA